VRDILVPPKIGERVREAVGRAKSDFDAVLVHGDEKVIALEDSFPAATEFSTHLRYTGYVVRKADVAAQVLKDRFDILVSAGGGRSGATLIAAALAASREMDASLQWLLISGPQVGPGTLGDSPANVTHTAHRPDLAQLMTKARVSVSQAGYNTVVESLAAGCQPVLVPFLREGEAEQLQRAERFAALGLATLVRPEALAGLAGAVGEALASRGGPTELPIRTDGAAKTARIIGEMLEKRRR
jgi:predicted glycosyltransferase